MSKVAKWREGFTKDRKTVLPENDSVEGMKLRNSLRAFAQPLEVHPKNSVRVVSHLEDQANLLIHSPQLVIPLVAPDTISNRQTRLSCPIPLVPAQTGL